MGNDRRPDATTRLLEDFVRQVSDEVVVPPFTAARRPPRLRGPQLRGTRHVIATAFVSAVVVAAIVLAVVYGPRSTDHGSGVANQPTQTKWRVAAPARWQREFLAANASNFGAPDTVACPRQAITTCYVTVNSIAVGVTDLTSAAYRTTDAGSTWQRLSLPGDTWLSSRFSCSSASTCAVGADVQFDPATAPDFSGRAAILTTDNGGRRWTVRLLPSSYGLVTDLSCPSRTHCVAVAWQRGADPLPNPQSGFDRYYPSSVLTTNDAGRSWSPATLPPTSSRSFRYALASNTGGSLTCPTVRTCDATGEEADIVTTDGSYVQTDDRSIALMSSDGGRSWTLTHQAGIAGPGTEGVACAGGSKCWMFANPGPGLTSPYDLFASDDGGLHWSPVPTTGLPLPSVAALTSITCPSVHECLVSEIGSNSAGGVTVLTTRDGGRQWRGQALPASSAGDIENGTAGVSCSTSGSCLAVVDESLPSPSSAMVDVVVTNRPGRARS